MTKEVRKTLRKEGKERHEGRKRKKLGRKGIRNCRDYDGEIRVETKKGRKQGR